ncbi:MAG: site-specific integrase [Gammaproteobacteria bacterium]|nr:site-specific integrase [Gammaproteobacteria bacterium]
MQLYERENSPYWWYRFSVNGSPVRGSTRRPLKDINGARRVMLKEYEKALNQVQFGEKPEISLQDAMEQTVASVEGATWYAYRTAMRRALGTDRFKGKGYYHFNPDMKLSALNQVMLDDHLLARRKEGWKNNTIINEVRFIQRMYNMMRRKYACNPDLEFQKPKPFHKTRYLSYQEEEEVLASIKEDFGNSAYAERAYDLFIILVDTGARVNEACDIDWGSIDMTNRLIEIYRPKTDILSLVPMSDRVYEMLKRRQNLPQPFMQMTKTVIYLNKKISAVCNRNKRIVAQRGKATAHSLRDTFATRMVSKGMSLQKVARLLGHSSTKMTEKYAQLEDQDVMEEARKILNA